MKPFKLAALFSHPIQYFAPLFRQLGQEPDIDLTVYYCERWGVKEYFDRGFGKRFKWDIPLLEGYHHKFLPNLRRSSKPGGFMQLINPAIISELRRKRFDAIWVHGYMYLTNWLTFMTAQLTKTPILLRGESNLLDPRPLHIRFAKELVLRPLFQKVAGCLYIGTHNKKFYRYYGVPEERLFFTPYTVDNTFFRQQAERLAPKRRELRAKWGIKDSRPIILFVGRLVSWKQPLLLLEAYKRVRQKFPCALLYVGDGPLRREIEKRAKQEAIPDVQITGFLNQSEIPQAYVAGDILVLPSSHEPWGLVVNEGMNFALPIIVSDRVGCAPDLVQEGENGFIFPYRSVEELTAVLEMLVSDAEYRRVLGQHSLEIIQDRDLKDTITGILAACHELSGRGR